MEELICLQGFIVFYAGKLLIPVLELFLPALVALYPGLRHIIKKKITPV